MTTTEANPSPVERLARRLRDLSAKMGTCGELIATQDAADGAQTCTEASAELLSKDAEIERLRGALRDTATWLHDVLEYPYGFRADPQCPESLVEFLVDASYADVIKHGDDITRDEVDEGVRCELDWSSASGTTENG
ncbi:MAG: hypothetical protein AAFR96_12305 [Planctomycetota bacterium]